MPPKSGPKSQPQFGNRLEWICLTLRMKSMCRWKLIKLVWLLRPILDLIPIIVSFLLLWPRLILPLWLGDIQSSERWKKGLMFWRRSTILMLIVRIDLKWMSGSCTLISWMIPSMIYKKWRTHRGVLLLLRKVIGWRLSSIFKCWKNVKIRKKYWRPQDNKKPKSKLWLCKFWAICLTPTWDLLRTSFSSASWTR